MNDLARFALVTGTPFPIFHGHGVGVKQNQDPNGYTAHWLFWLCTPIHVPWPELLWLCTPH